MNDIIAWIEINTTLHKTVEAIYVVDGYEICVCYDGNPFAGPFKAETLKEAYELAMKNIK